jgi:hypothetical protein
MLVHTILEVIVLTDLRNFILWVVFICLVIGIIDTIVYKKPRDNETENIIIRPSYDHSLWIVITGKQE